MSTVLVQASSFENVRSTNSQDVAQRRPLHERFIALHVLPCHSTSLSRCWLALHTVYWLILIFAVIWQLANSDLSPIAAKLPWQTDKVASINPYQRIFLQLNQATCVFCWAAYLISALVGLGPQDARRRIAEHMPMPMSCTIASLIASGYMFAVVNVLCDIDGSFQTSYGKVSAILHTVFFQATPFMYLRWGLLAFLGKCLQDVVVQVEELKLMATAPTVERGQFFWRDFRSRYKKLHSDVKNMGSSGIGLSLNLLLVGFGLDVMSKVFALVANYWDTPDLDIYNFYEQFYWGVTNGIALATTAKGLFRISAAFEHGDESLLGLLTELMHTKLEVQDKDYAVIGGLVQYLSYKRLAWFIGALPCRLAMTSTIVLYATGPTLAMICKHLGFI